MPARSKGLTCLFQRFYRGGKLLPVEGVNHSALVQCPILAAGDVCGSVMFMQDDSHRTAGDAEVKLVQAAAAFLGRQMEE